MNSQQTIAILAAIALLSAGLVFEGVERTYAQAQGPGNAPAGGQTQGGGNAPAGPRAQDPADQPYNPPPLPPNVVRVCPDPGPLMARCHSQRRTDVHGRPSTPSPGMTTASPPWTPAQLQDAYGLTTFATTAGIGRTVAIVDAFHDDRAYEELTFYRTYYQLPPCTTDSGCFKQVDQRGGASYPRVDIGWAQEIAIDIQMVSAICPLCNILLVEADDNSFANLGAAVNYAASQPGVVAISNSYGGREWVWETNYEGPYNHPGIAVTVSSGDSGYGVSFPAASQYVTAVGGTSLTNNNGTWNETAWSGAGSGCSHWVPKPSWQTDTGCRQRTVADVSAVADPATAVSVYSVYGGGLTAYGGTSVASPIIASVYALAGNTSSIDSRSFPYTNYTPGNFRDVTSGSNGRCGRNSYLCTAVSGYDGPTGLGTPKGTGGF